MAMPFNITVETTDLLARARQQNEGIAARPSRRWIGGLALLVVACASNQPPATSEPSAGPAEPPATPAVTDEQAPASPLVAIPNAKMALPGVVTGGVPTDENLQQAKTLGYKTVISLLPDAEGSAEATRARELGLRFVSIPIAGADDLTEDNARRLGEAMAAPDAKPLILHCGSGNRAGALLALEAFYVEGRPASEALQLGIDAGLTKSKADVEQRLQAAGQTAPAP